MGQASKSSKDDEKKKSLFCVIPLSESLHCNQNSVVQVLHRCIDVSLLKQSFFLGANCQS